MGGTRILLDTGPLVAYLNSHDMHHDWAQACWKEFDEPLLACESVVSEAIFCVMSERLEIEPILQLVERKIIRVEFSWERNQADILRLLRKYSDQSMSVADACLVRMSELHLYSQVFTTDRDFLVYRRNGRQVIPVLSPWN